jgi:vitamin B12 transporter
VDGQRIAGASSGTASLEFLSIDQIERIEVVRGSRSSLYGSDAIGGVIQIFTRRGSDAPAQPYVRLAAGSHSTYERTAGISGGEGGTRYNLGGTLNETRGIDNTGSPLGENRDDDAFRNRALSMNLSHQFNEQLEVGLSALDQRGKAEYDDTFSGTRPYDDFQLSTVAGYVSNRFTDNWLSRLEAGYSEDRRDTRNKDPQGFLSNFNTYRDSVNWLNTLELTESHQLLGGLDWYEDRLNSSTEYTETSRWNQAAYAQHRFNGEDFGTELGMRHDDNQAYGNQNSWNGALIIPVNPDNQLIASYSEGFRAPTFNDLYFPDDCFNGFCSKNSNPDLDPEQSKTWEGQWRSALNRNTQLEVSVYRTDIDDAIVFTQNGPENVGKARINGLETGLAYQAGSWTGNLAAGLIDPRNRDTGNTLPRRAKRTLTLDVDRQMGPFSAGASWRGVAGRYDDVQNNVEMSGYGLVGLRGSWQASRELGFDLSLDNVFDKDYVDATYGVINPNTSQTIGRQGYNTEGRTVLLALNWTPDL